jgi:uncharacterized damage-inducible protein DinB
MDRTLDSTLLHIARTRLVQDYPGQISACLDVLTDEDVWWRPNEQANAVGNLVLHLAGSNRYYLEQVIGGRDIGRNRDAEFAARGGHTREQLKDVWEQQRVVVEGVLAGLDPSQMVQSTDRTGKVTTYAQILLHVTHHNAAHMGQIVWITKMRHAGALDDLWMKMRTK